MTFDDLRERATEALENNRTYANEQLGWSLPEQYVHGLRLIGHQGIVRTLEESIEELLSGACFPRVVDLGVAGILDGKTLILWYPSGEPPVERLEDTWNQGYGPFKPIGVISPRESFRLTAEELRKLAVRWAQG